MAVAESSPIRIVGSEEAAKGLGALLAEVEQGRLVVIVNRQTGQVRATIIPGYPRELLSAPGLEPAALNGGHPGGPA